MARVIDYAAHSARRRRGAKSGVRDPMVDLIAEALAYFGGETHRRMVLDRLVGARAEGEDPELYRLRLIDVFEAQCDRGRFKKPFGRDSHRWALSEPMRASSVVSMESGAAV